MTKVNVDLRRPGQTGPEPVPGHVEARLYRRHHVDAPDDGPEDYVLLPVAYCEELVGGQCVLTLEPTGIGEAWVISERVTGGLTRYVEVPAPVAGQDSVDYGDLVDVDPRTLQPAAAAPAWDDLEARVETLEELVLALNAEVYDLEARVGALETGGGSGSTDVSVTATWQVNPQAGVNPGGRQVTMETGKLATSTWMRFDPTNQGDKDMTAALLAATSMFMQQATEASNWARVNVTGPATIANGNQYVEVPIELVNSGGRLAPATWQSAAFVIYAALTPDGDVDGGSDA